MLVHKNFVSLLLCACLLNVQILPAHTFSLSQDTVNVAFIGIDFRDVDPEQQKSVENRISILLEEESSFYNIPDSDIQNQLKESQLRELRNQQDKEAFRTAAEILNADFVFAGKFENTSKDSENTALVGSIVRYDVATDNMYSLSIKSFYDNFSEELVRINDQLIQTIVPEEKKGFFKRYLPGIVIVGATVAAMVILMGGTDGQSSGDGFPTPPFHEN